MALANLVQRQPERGGIGRSFDFRTKAEVYRVDLCVKMEETLGATERPEQIRDIIPEGRKCVSFSRHAGSPDLTTRLSICAPAAAKDAMSRPLRHRQRIRRPSAAHSSGNVAYQVRFERRRGRRPGLDYLF